ncbi:MAG: hypothetical protein PF795_12770 [Kiritimatiellae bacterium]|jgi:hypothetical protein|nr:hypothetical protein [Kiritimatiellia bacterium]
MDPKPTNDSVVAPARRSFSAEASRQAELDRLRRMSVEERILEALNMTQRYAWLKPVVEDE